MQREQSPTSTPPALLPYYKWAVVFMLWFLCFFNYADRQAIFSVFPKLKEEFGFDKEQLGWIASAFMWVYAAGAPLAGFIADRVRRKHLVLGGCLFWSFVTMLTGRCSRLGHFIAVRALEGFGETFYFPASTSLMSDYHDGRTRSRALAIHNSGVYIGTIAGGWLGAWFAVTLGWRAGFYFFGGAGMLLALVLYRFLREPARGEVEAIGINPEASLDSRRFAHALSVTLALVATTLLFLLRRPLGIEHLIIGVATLLWFLAFVWRCLRTPTAFLLLAAFVCANSVATIFLTWTPTFLVEKFHFKLTSAGLSGSVFIHLATALSIPVGGWLADRWSQRMPGGRILVQALGLLIGSAFVFVVGSTERVGVLLLTMSLFGLCKGFYDSNIFAALFDVVGPRARGTAAGIMNTVGWGGGALGPVAVGLFAKYGRHATEMENMSEAISFCSVIYLVGAALLFTAAFVFAPRDIGRSQRSLFGPH